MFSNFFVDYDKILCKCHYVNLETKAGSELVSLQDIVLAIHVTTKILRFADLCRSEKEDGSEPPSFTRLRHFAQF